MAKDGDRFLWISTRRSVDVLGVKTRVKDEVRAFSTSFFTPFMNVKIGQARQVVLTAYAAQFPANQC